MKKKIASLFLAVTMTAAALAGCGSTAPAATEPTKEAVKEETTETAKTPAAETTTTDITYWSMWNSTEGQAKVIQEAAAEYEAETGIKVNIEWKGRDVKNLIGPALDGGEKVDLFDTDYGMVVKNNAKYLADVTEMAAAVGYEEHVMPVLLDNAKTWGDGKLLTLPYQPFVTGVWYDKAMFEAAGITKVPETWSEFLDVCQKLKDSGVNAITVNHDTVTLLYGFQLARYVGQEKIAEVYASGDWASIPEAKKAADDIRSLWELGYMSEYAPAQYPDGQNEIGFGESCMILNASWIPNEIVQNTGNAVDFGYFPWPSVEGGVDGPEGSMVGSQGFGVVANGKEQAAFDFAHKLVTGAYDLKMAEAVSSIPADTANTEWPAAIKGAEPYFKKVTKTYNWAIGLEDDPNKAGIIIDALSKLVKQEITSDEFIGLMSTAK